MRTPDQPGAPRAVSRGRPPRTVPPAPGPAGAAEARRRLRGALDPARLRARRRSLDLSAADVVERLRARGWAVSETSLYSWESGRRRAPAALVGPLAAALRVRVEDLVAEGAG